MRHIAGMHKADAFQEKRPARLRRMPPVWAWVAAALAVKALGSVLSSDWAADHRLWVFNLADLAGYAAFACLVAALMTERRALRSVVRAMRAANKAAGLGDGDDGDPAEMDRAAA